SALTDVSHPSRGPRSGYLFCFFFLIVLGTPLSTLFPYTTLFRSAAGCARASAPRRILILCLEQSWIANGRRRIEPFNPAMMKCRSEEHTSELQSRGHLVCRLLLEKKKLTNAILVIVPVTRRKPSH